MKNLKIRKATIKDLSIILRFQEKSFGEMKKYVKGITKKGKLFVYLKSEIKKILISPKGYFTIAEVNGQPVGCGFARIERFNGDWSKYKKRGHLGLLFVEKKFRRKGIAEAIQDERIRWLKSKGVKFVYNRIFAGNRPSLKMKEKKGFKPYMIETYKIV